MSKDAILPPLPEPHLQRLVGMFTADQMQDFARTVARAAVLAERERIAAWAESKSLQSRGGTVSWHQVAAAIRAGEDGK
jgi:hypothetical protein